LGEKTSLAPPDWGKHRLALKFELPCDVLLHSSNLAGDQRYFQWYEFITVIATRYGRTSIVVSAWKE
jgi:hypothetical protein